MNKIAKGALIGSGVAVAAIGAMGAASYTMTHSLVRIALDRSLTINPSLKTKKLISGCKQMEDIDRIYRQNAHRLKNRLCRTVEIKGRDGERLVGHLCVKKGAKRTIIAMHGWRTTWINDFGSVSDFFYSNDCNVLYAEQRGHDQSGGSYTCFGLLERFDCIDWINYINSISELSRLPIYLCGVSMGASTVLMATGQALPENVAGVIADCGFTSPCAEWKHVVNKNLHMPFTAHQATAIRNLCKKRIKVDPDGYSTLIALKKCKIPVLFVHGTKDRFVPIEMTYENYKACACADKRLFVVPDAEHGMSYYTDRKGYEAEVKRLWRDCECSAAGS